MSARKPEKADFEVCTDKDGNLLPLFETEDGDRYIGWGHVDPTEYKQMVGAYLDTTLDELDRAELTENDMTVVHLYGYIEGEDPAVYDEFYVKVCPADHALAAPITIGTF